MTEYDLTNEFKKRRSEIIENIAIIAKDYGRDLHEIQLVAACKTQTNEMIQAAIKSGQKIFGENKVQEGQKHFKNLENDIELRLIGPLQTNKANDAVKLFNYIESLDRENLALELAKSIQKIGKSPKFLIQVNIGEEAQKSGILPNELETFIKKLNNVYDIKPIGLMCIPPNNIPPAPYFALLQKLSKNYGFEQLSMGMSSDFETAIKFGATHIRIGTALFGARN